MDISKDLRKRLLVYQQNEISEHHIHQRLASTVKSPENGRVLAKIANAELRHYRTWRIYRRVCCDRTYYHLAISDTGEFLHLFGLYVGCCGPDYRCFQLLHLCRKGHVVQKTLH